MAQLNGEVWFKLDAATGEGMARINNTRQSLKKTADNIALAASLCPTKLQTCVFAQKGLAPTATEQSAYLNFLTRLVDQGVKLHGVLLYGIVRPSLQPEAPQLSALPAAWLEEFAHKIKQIGLAVWITP